MPNPIESYKDLSTTELKNLLLVEATRLNTKKSAISETVKKVSVTAFLLNCLSLLLTNIDLVENGFDISDIEINFLSINIIFAAYSLILIKLYSRLLPLEQMVEALNGELDSRKNN